MTGLRNWLVGPADLAVPRAELHAAVQPLSLAARANLKPEPDDSHSNLGWSGATEMFVSHRLTAQGDAVGLRLVPMELLVLRGGEVVDALPLAGTTPGRACAWLDDRLKRAGLVPTSSVSLPYDLPPEVGGITSFSGDDGARGRLAAWYALAAACLQSFVDGLPDDWSPGPSPVRCWPHHFDIASYVGLAEGDPETAKGIGVGLSPGDETYEQPYFYINPWPHLDSNALAAPVRPGHWHTEGFVGMIATGEEVLTLTDVRAETVAFLRSSFDAGVAALGD